MVSKPEKQKVLMPGQVQMEIVILLSGQWKLRIMWRHLEEGSLHFESESVSHSVVSDCDTMDCSPPGSSVHLQVRILQVRILEWVTIPFSRGSSWPRDWTWISCTAGRFFTIWAIGKSQLTEKLNLYSILKSRDITYWQRSISQSNGFSSSHV